MELEVWPHPNIGTYVVPSCIAPWALRNLVAFALRHFGLAPVSTYDLLTSALEKLKGQLPTLNLYFYKQNTIVWKVSFPIVRASYKHLSDK
jgi:hypothetical protein